VKGERGMLLKRSNSETLGPVVVKVDLAERQLGQEFQGDLNNVVFKVISKPRARNGRRRVDTLDTARQKDRGGVKNGRSVQKHFSVGKGEFQGFNCVGHSFSEIKQGNGYRLGMVSISLILFSKKEKQVQLNLPDEMVSHGGCKMERR